MDECWLCIHEKIVVTKTDRFPCPACCIGKFLFYSEQKKIATTPSACQDCGDLLTTNKIRCLPCHRIWQQQDILCNECGENHHKAKFVRCYYCNVKKNLR